MTEFHRFELVSLQFARNPSCFVRLVHVSSLFLCDEYKQVGTTEER